MTAELLARYQANGLTSVLPVSGSNRVFGASWQVLSRALRPKASTSRSRYWPILRGSRGD